MSVIKLVMVLIWKMATFQVRPGDLIVREFKFDYVENNSVFTSINYIDVLILPEYQCESCSKYNCECPGIHYRMFGHNAAFGNFRLVRID